MSFKLGVLGCREYLKGVTHSSQGLSLLLTILMKETFTDLSDISWRYDANTVVAMTKLEEKVCTTFTTTIKTHIPFFLPWEGWERLSTYLFT